MFTVVDSTTIRLEIKKSKFFVFIFNCNDELEVRGYLTKISQNLKDATHYCSAYIIEGRERAFDDGEPSGTAGLPILNILKRNNLTNVLCVVVRYFGGVKLGASGLIRAYSTCAKEVVSVSSIIPYKKKKKMIISFNYDNEKYLNEVFKEFIVEKVYYDNITYVLVIDEDFDFREVDNLLIEKKDV